MKKLTEEQKKVLNFVWEKRLSLRAEGDKLGAEGDKIWAEGSKLRHSNIATTNRYAHAESKEKVIQNIRDLFARGA